MPSFLERYHQGECIAVWEELVALGNQVYKNPLYSDVWAVAQETMRRVRHNLLEVAVPSLRALGYVFIHDHISYEAGLSIQDREWIQHLPPLHTEPSSTIVEQLEIFEREVGPLPLSLRAFYQEIGGLNFIGWYQGETPEKQSLVNKQEGSRVVGFDPAFVYAFHPDLLEEVVEWTHSDDGQSDWGQIGVEGSTPSQETTYALVIAPDSYHKMNISGSAPYQIQILDEVADALLLDEWHRTTFVKYLRMCCHYAGLPGLEKMPHSALSQRLGDLRKKMVPM